VYYMASAILAAILSFFIPGLGQFYAGSLSKGILMFVLFIILLFFVSVLFKDWLYSIINLLFSLYVAYDAYQMAKYH